MITTDFGIWRGMRCMEISRHFSIKVFYDRAHVRRHTPVFCYGLVVMAREIIQYHSWDVHRGVEQRV